MTFLLTVAFRATKISTTLKADVPVGFRATKNLEDTMLPINYRSWQCSFSELPKSCQQWKLTFLLTIAFIATEIPTILRVDAPIASRATWHLENIISPLNYRSWQRSFRGYLWPGRRYVSHQLMELTTVTFRASTIFSTVGVDILECSFQSYLKIEDAMFPVNCLSWQP